MNAGHPLGPAAGFNVRNVPTDPFTDLHYITAVIPLDLTPPTDAERAQWKREAEVRKEAEAKQRVEFSKLRQSATGTLRKILNLHAPVGEGTSWFTCGACYDGGSMGDHEDWPCETARLALEDVDGGGSGA